MKLTSSCLIDESISIHMIMYPYYSRLLPRYQQYSDIALKVLGRYQITAQHYQHYLIAIDGSSSDTNGQPKDVNMLQPPFWFIHVSSESAALYSLLGMTTDYLWYAYLIKMKTNFLMQFLPQKLVFLTSTKRNESYENPFFTKRQ